MTTRAAVRYSDERISRAPRKAVLVHGGARDSYQLALALSEAGLLDSLVTDLFWPSDRKWADKLAKMLPRLNSLVARRTVHGLPANQVKVCAADGLRCLLLDRLPRIPFSLRRRSNRAADAALGRAAGKRARRVGAGLVSYSYFAYDAIREYAAPAMLFQVHPHPATVRRILHEELEAHPDCASSLRQEWELALPEEDYQHLIDETTMVTEFMVASSFTRRSLMEHGTPPEQITTIPYGVDLVQFYPRARQAKLRTDTKLRLLFVGRINQRKGVKYLLQALRMFNPSEVHLTVCGRVVDDLELFRPFGSGVEVRPSVNAEELIRAYQSADLFVFPSVAEGFGQVLLESLACGLPILSTTHTAAPDLIEDGVEGFIVEPRRPDLLAQRIAWALSHRDLLNSMRQAARARAEQFTWGRFRSSCVEAVRSYLMVPPQEHRR